MARRLCKPICAKEDRNGPPSANQGQQSPEAAMLFAHFRTPPTCPVLCAGAEPKSQGVTSQAESYIMLISIYGN